MNRISAFQFIREVRQETARVTWPSRRETLISTGVVVLMVIVAALFFFVVDEVISIGVRFLLGIGA